MANVPIKLRKATRVKADVLVGVPTEYVQQWRSEPTACALVAKGVLLFHVTKDEEGTCASRIVVDYVIVPVAMRRHGGASALIQHLQGVTKIDSGIVACCLNSKSRRLFQRNGFHAGTRYNGGVLWDKGDTRCGDPKTANIDYQHVRLHDTQIEDELAARAQMLAISEILIEYKFDLRITQNGTILITITDPATMRMISISPQEESSDTTVKRILNRFRSDVTIKDDCPVCCIPYTENGAKLARCSRCSMATCVRCQMELFEHGHGIITCPFCRFSFGERQTASGIRARMAAYRLHL